MSRSEADGLVRRLEALEAIEGVRVLKARYAEAVDETLANPTAERAATVAALFADDAVADYGQFGRYEGRTQISEFFATVLPGVASWARHSMMNPRIEIGDGTATARWYGMIYAVFRSKPSAGPQPLWVRYEDAYVHTAEGWRFQSVLAHFYPPA